MPLPRRLYLVVAVAALAVAVRPAVIVEAFTIPAHRACHARPSSPTSLSLSTIMAEVVATPAAPKATTTTTTTSGEAIPWVLNSKVKFDQEQDWGWVYSTVPTAAVGRCDHVVVEGVIPTDLDGIFYRAGPGQFERNGRRYQHVLDGDGFVAAFTIHNGQVTYRGAFVETEFYQAEQRANNVLYRNVFGTDPVGGGVLQNVGDVTLKNVANTNVLSWHDRLFVLWEGGRPYELDPITLQTLPMANDGPFVGLGHPAAFLRGVTFDRNGQVDDLLQVGRFFTAHPRIVQDTLIAFSAAQNALTKDMEIDFIEYDRQWRQVHRQRHVVVDCAAPPHDFGVGDQHYVFVQNSLTMDTLPFLLGRKAPTQCMQLQLGEHTPALLHVVPRPRQGGQSQDADAVQVPIPNYFNVHMVGDVTVDNDNIMTVHSNGWDLSDRRYFPNARSVPFLGNWGGQYPDFETSVPPAKLYRTTVDLATHTLLEHVEVVPGLVMEFPTQDVDHNVYMSVANVDHQSWPGVGCGQLQLATGALQCWWAEPKIFTGEMTAVPKRNDERGSWLLTLLYDKQNKRTSLAVFDSERFAAGPVGRAHLPFPVSYGLHNCFVPSKSK